jgi:hypothetical protein
MAQRYLKPADCNNIDPNENIRSFNCSESPNGGMECEGVGIGGQFKDCQTCLDQCPRSQGPVDPSTKGPIGISTKGPIGISTKGPIGLSTETKAAIGVGAVVGVIGFVCLIIFMIIRTR